MLYICLHFTNLFLFVCLLTVPILACGNEDSKIYIFVEKEKEVNVFLYSVKTQLHVNNLC